MFALVTSDYALIPVTPEYQPVVGAAQTFRPVQTVRQKLNPTLGDPFFLLTQVDARKRDHAAYTHYLRERYGDRILANVIRTSAQLAEVAEGDVAAWLASLRETSLRGDVWLVGGGALVRSFREAALIDRYVLSVHPVLLGDGIPLFDGTLPGAALRLIASTSFPSGLVQLTYDRALLHG